MDGEAWWGYSPWGHKESDTTEEITHIQGNLKFSWFSYPELHKTHPLFAFLSFFFFCWRQCLSIDDKSATPSFLKSFEEKKAQNKLQRPSFTLFSRQLISIKMGCFPARCDNVQCMPGTLILCYPTGRVQLHCVE